MSRTKADRKDEAEATNRVSLLFARQKLGELSFRASLGDERIILTSRGKPVAALIGLRDLAKLAAAAA